MPGLDGLRAIAVLAVFFYHAGFLWAAGGFLGVESFFVVSGYLITALLMREYLSRERIDLPNFWLRRARRLLPALWLLLGGVLLITWLLAPDAWLRLREDIWGALFYGTNWLYIFREIPYFEQFGRPPLLQHLWSLGVEEQFYLFWPLILWFLCWSLRVRTVNVKRLVAPLLVLIIVSSALMVFLYNPALDPSRVYYGTDTRAAGFLVGAVLAVLLPPGKLFRIPAILAWFALSALLLLYWRLDEFSEFLYNGGFLLTALLTALVMLSAAQPGTLLSKSLGVGLLRWIGTRSYSIYLWHWPIMQVNRYGFKCGLSAWGCAGVNLALTLVLAELSYRLVENPIRQNGFTVWGRNIRQRVPQPVWGIGILVGLILVVVSVTSLQAQTSNQQPNNKKVLAEWDADEVSFPGKNMKKTPSSTPIESKLRMQASPVPFDYPIDAFAYPANTEFNTDANIDQAGSSSLIPTLTPESLPPTSDPRSLQVTLIGDSVMEGTRKIWEEVLDPSVYVLDANRSRTMRDMPEILESLESQDKLAPLVVLHIGTNRPFEPDEFDALMVLLLDYGVERAIFVNVNRPVTWEYTVNKRIAEGVNRWSQAELVDWYTISKGYPGYFGEDQTHVTRTGARAYVRAILAVLELPGMGE